MPVTDGSARRTAVSGEVTGSGVRRPQSIIDYLSFALSDEIATALSYSHGL